MEILRDGEANSLRAEEISKLFREYFKETITIIKTPEMSGPEEIIDYLRKQLTESHII